MWKGIAWLQEFITPFSAAGEADVEGDTVESKPRTKEPQDVAGMFLLDVMFFSRNTQVAERLEKLLQVSSGSHYAKVVSLYI